MLDHGESMKQVLGLLTMGKRSSFLVLVKRKLLSLDTRSHNDGRTDSP